MTKRYSLYLIVLLLGVGVGRAQTGQTLEQQFEAVKKMNYLNQAGVYFVNEVTNATPKEFNVIVQQDESEDLKLLLKNESDKNLNFRVKFSDQVVDSEGRKQGCGAEYEKGFANFVTIPRKGNIAVPGKSELTKKIKLNFPVGVEGIQRGCIAYGVMEDIKNTNSVFSIITRKVLYLNALIGGTGEINYKIAKGDITKRMDGAGDFSIAMNVQNIGNVDSKISIEGKINNILGLEKPISTSGTVHKGEEGILMAQIGQLPSYGGLFAIKVTVKDKPDFGFDGTKFGIDPKIVAGTEQKITIMYFKRHRRMFIVFPLIMTILYIAFRKHKPLQQQGSV